MIYAQVMDSSWKRYFPSKTQTKKFGELLAVDDVSFEVKEGEIYGIAGPNGAGKTSLFNLITGIPYHADNGSVFLRGEAISELSPHKIYELGIARTFQKENRLRHPDRARKRAHRRCIRHGIAARTI